MSDNEQIKQDTLNLMLDHGHAIHYIAGDKDRPTRAYTVGRTMMGRPELLMVGPFPVATFGEILNDACRRDDDSPMSAGDVRAQIVPDRRVKAVEADPVAAMMYGAMAQFGEIEALQLMWPDDAGRFPDDAAYAHPAESQPLFLKG